jgi:hypothetical protein
VSWEDISPATMFGFGGEQPDRGSGGVGRAMDSTVVTDGPSAPATSPDSPLFWFAVFLALAGGAIYVVHHVHIGASAKAGPASGSVSI